jgi:hypothetical protein
MKKSFPIKILFITFIISFLLLLLNRILIFFFNSSFQGYIFERVIFFIFFFSSFLLLRSKQKFILNNYIVFLMLFIFITNFIRTFHTYLIMSQNEIDLNSKYTLKQSTTIESGSIFEIYKRESFIEKPISGWHSVEYQDGKIIGLSEFDSIKLIKEDKEKLLVEFFYNNEVKLDTFNIKSNSK